MVNEHPTKDEVNAKFDANEFRFTAFMATMMAKIDARFSQVDERISRLETHMDVRMEEFDGRLIRLESAMTQLGDRMRQYMLWMIGTVVASALAVVFGLATFNATLLSNMVVSFESGKQTANALAAASVTLDVMRRELEQSRQLAARHAVEADTTEPIDTNGPPPRATH